MPYKWHIDQLLGQESDFQWPRGQCLGTPVGWEEAGLRCQIIQCCSIEYRYFHQNSQEAMVEHPHQGICFLWFLVLYDFPKQVLVSIHKGKTMRCIRGHHMPLGVV